MEEVSISDIDLEDITFQSRLDFDPDTIGRLAQDIERFGLRNPIGLRRKESGYQVIYGWERIKANMLLGNTVIEARIYGEISDLEAQLHNISDNLQHEELTTLEKANQVKRLRETYNLDVEDIKEFYGGKKQYVYDLLKLTTMEEEIQRAVHNNEISLYQSIEIGKHPVSKRLEMLNRTIVEDLSISSLRTIRNKARDDNEVIKILSEMREMERRKRDISHEYMKTRPKVKQYLNDGDLVFHALVFNKELMYEPLWSLAHKFLLPEPVADNPFTCEYSWSIPARENNWICPNDIQYVVVPPFRSYNPEPNIYQLQHRGGWFFWCEDCMLAHFPNIIIHNEIMFNTSIWDDEIFEHVI